MPETDLHLTPTGLANLDQALGKFVADGEVAGVSTRILLDGKLVHQSVQGLKDIASAEPLGHDTIFRIFSMTKPVTAVAMMILYDRGLWTPEDTIAKHLPEFADIQVYTGTRPDGSFTTEASRHPPTLRELLTHTAGLRYGFDPAHPIDAGYTAAGIWTSGSLAEFSRRVAQTPLAYQPGSQWLYSLSMDLQGAIIERLTGQTLPDFMRDHIFAPLGMVDTDFYVPAGKRARLATLYRHSRTKGLTVLDRTFLGGDAGEIPAVPNGGGGLFSTGLDYSRFAQMLLNGGVLEGTRIISDKAAKLMTTNQLSDTILAGGYGIGHQQIRPGFGQAFNGAVFHDPPLAGSRVGAGTYQWDGAAGTWFWIDPASKLVFVGLIQRMDERGPPLQALTQEMIADALAGI